jgi:hypothetical protein
MPSKDAQIENMAMADFYKIPQNPSSVIKSGKYWFQGKGKPTWPFSAQRQQISAPPLLALRKT